MRTVTGVWVGLLCALWVPLAHADLIGGVEFPDGAVSFADVVVSYSPGESVSDANKMPELALGIPDTDYVSLGWAGAVVLRFSDNSLTTSGNDALDLWVFEFGSAVEPTGVEISQDGLSWIDVGEVAGATAGVDIDAFVGSGVELWAQYSYVRLTDLDARIGGSPTGGADIDAVGAISSAPPVVDQPVVPEPATLALLGFGLAGFACRRLAQKKA